MKLIDFVLGELLLQDDLDAGAGGADEAVQLCLQLRAPQPLSDPC